MGLHTWISKKPRTAYLSESAMKIWQMRWAFPWLRSGKHGSPLLQKRIGNRLPIGTMRSLDSQKGVFGITVN